MRGGDTDLLDQPEVWKFRDCVISLFAHFRANTLRTDSFFRLNLAPG
jgi:hypothetical protein